MGQSCSEPGGAKTDGNYAARCVRDSKVRRALDKRKRFFRLKAELNGHARKRLRARMSNGACSVRLIVKLQLGQRQFTRFRTSMAVSR